MTPEKRNELEKQRSLLQQEMKARAYAEDNVLPFLEILECLNRHKANYHIAAFAPAHEACKLHLEKIFSESPYAMFRLNDHIPIRQNQIITDLLRRYPSIHPFRYVPELALAPYGNNLNAIVEYFKIQNSKVYCSWLSFPFTIEVCLSDLVQVDQNEIFNFWYGDVAIFPAGYDWLLAFSLEEAWYYGNAIESDRSIA